MFFLIMTQGFKVEREDEKCKGKGNPQKRENKKRDANWQVMREERRFTLK